MSAEPSAFTGFVLLATGFGLKSIADAVWEWHSTRPRTVTTARNYYSPCSDCTIAHTSEIGVRLRELSVRMYSRVRRGQTWWAGGRRRA